MKNIFDGLLSRLDTAEKWISELKDISIETQKSKIKTTETKVFFFFFWRNRYPMIEEQTQNVWQKQENFRKKREQGTGKKKKRNKNDLEFPQINV